MDNRLAQILHLSEVDCRNDCDDEGGKERIVGINLLDDGSGSIRHHGRKKARADMRQLDGSAAIEDEFEIFPLSDHFQLGFENEESRGRTYPRAQQVSE